MKIPPKSLYIPKDPEPPQPTQSDEIKEENKEVEDTEHEEDKDEESPEYDIENTLEKLDYEDRKWLLFQLVLSNPIFLEEVLLGFPMSLVGDDDVNDHQTGDDDEVVGVNKKVKREGLSTIEEDGGPCESDEVSISEENDQACEMIDLSLEAKGEAGEIEEKKITVEEKKESKEPTEREGETEAVRPARLYKKQELLPILVPESEWLLTYCQIDAIPSSTRDTFLLNLFLMSPTHSSILQPFYSSLEAGRVNHEEYEAYPDEIEWKDRFNEANEGRRVLARAGMGVDYGSVIYWEELGEGREGVWDVALCEIGGWLMRDLPCPTESIGDSSPEVEDIGRIKTDVKPQEGSRKVDESEDCHASGWCIAQDYIKMTAFTIQTKTLSLIRQITRPDSGSNSWPGRYRYRALTINDLAKLSVLLTRSPIPLRKLLHDEIRSISAEIVVLCNELEGAECEWVRVDECLAWELECVQRGLDDVGCGYLWEGVMTAWYRKSV